MTSHLARRIWRRIAPGMPSGALRLLDPVVRLEGGRPILGLPRLSRVLVIAPHPDDESLGCGGTLALLSRGGTEATVCFATDGEAVATRWNDRPETAEQRRSEAQEACRLLGITAAPRFLGRANERLADDLEAFAKDLQGVIDEVRPEAVMLPWPFDAHPDHRAVTNALALCHLPSVLEAWAYEVWTPLWANRLVDISEVVDVKAKAIEAHRADHAIEPDLALALNRYRALSGQTRSTHAEAFLALPATTLVALVQ